MKKIEEKQLQSWYNYASLALIVYMIIRIIMRFTIDQMNDGLMANITSLEWQIVFFSDPVFMFISLAFILLGKAVFSAKYYEISIVFNLLTFFPLFAAFRMSITLFLPIVLIMINILALKWYKR